MILKMKLLPVVRVMLMLLLLSLLTVCCERAETNRFASVKLEEGDLVFRRGTGAKSRAVMQADSLGIYSHVGIAVRRDESFGVIHVTPGERQKGDTVDKVKMESLDEFWSTARAVHGAVYRLKDSKTGAMASSQALRLLDKGILFDHDYLLNDTTQMYCTELVWCAYSLAGVDISSGRRSRINMPVFGGMYIFPSDIYLNPQFELVFSF